MLARGATDDERTRMFARYSLIGALSDARPARSRRRCRMSWSRPASTRLAAFRLMFYAYAALGARERRALSSPARMRRRSEARHARRSDRRARTVYKLAALFSLDAFAGGFVVQSLLALWLFERFDLSLSAASLFFFWSSTLSAFSFPVAAWLAKRIGLVNTMVFTHIPVQHLPDPGGILAQSVRGARRCCCCARRCRRWTCRPAPPTSWRW